MKKQQENFFQPVAVRDLVKPLIDRHGGVKKKWRVYVAALIALAERPDDEIGRRISEVAGADVTETGFDELVGQVRARRANGRKNEPAATPPAESHLANAFEDDPEVVNRNRQEVPALPPSLPAKVVGKSTASRRSKRRSGSGGKVKR